MAWTTWRQLQRPIVGTLALACAVALTHPSAAHAGYPLQAPARVALGFGANYRSGEATSASTHRGVDLAASEGVLVTAPLAGRVSFVGRVPGVGGASVRAVTIETASGAVTLLPLQSTRVAKGVSVAEGDAIGSLAENGDGSSAGTHLHVGVRRGDLYVDPLSVLSAPAVGGNGFGAGAGAAAEAPESGAAGAALQPAGARPAVGSPAGGTIASVAGSDVGAAKTSPHAATPGERVAAGVRVAGVPRSAATAAGASSSRATALTPASQGRQAEAQAAVDGAGAARSFDALFASAARGAQRAARAAALGLLGTLVGLGLLWPLWRKGGQKGMGEDHVSGVGDDVAAVVGR